MTRPRLLLIETSTRRGLVGLAEGDELRGLHVLEESRRHARDLAPLCGAMLRDQGWRARDLDGVVVGRGPGSYTGLRVGLASAKALAYATGCALLAIDSFAVIARQAPADVRSLDVIADAQQDRLYWQPFERECEGWRTVGELAVVSVAEWLAARRPEAWVSGPGVSAKARLLPADLRRVDEDMREPRAEALLWLGLRRFIKGERDDVYAAEPLYLRPSAAEEQWDRREAQGAARQAGATGPQADSP